MEHKIYEEITYNNNGKTIHLKVIPSIDHDCTNCFFYSNINCINIENIVRRCIDFRRIYKTSIIFKEINNTIMKKTIDIYVVMQVHTKYRSFCDVFTSFEEANNRFEELLKYYKEVKHVPAKVWNSEAIPSQLKVYVIEDVILYLCKETKEIDIEIDSNK